MTVASSVVMATSWSHLSPPCPLPLGKGRCHAVTEGLGKVKKNSPNTGREFNSRGSTRFESYDSSLKPVTEPSVQLTSYRVQFSARGWFSLIFSGRSSQLSTWTLCQKTGSTNRPGHCVYISDIICRKTVMSS